MDDALIQELANPPCQITPDYRTRMYNAVMRILTHTYSNTQEYIEAVKIAAGKSKVFTLKQKKSFLNVNVPKYDDDDDEIVYSSDCDST